MMYSYNVDFEKPLRLDNLLDLYNDLMDRFKPEKAYVEFGQASFMSPLPPDTVQPVLDELSSRYENRFTLRVGSGVK